MIASEEEEKEKRRKSEDDDEEKKIKRGKNGQQKIKRKELPWVPKTP